MAFLIPIHPQNPQLRLVRQALAAMHEPVRYRPVETDGAQRAALRIAQVLDNREWAR